MNEQRIRQVIAAKTLKTIWTIVDGRGVTLTVLRAWIDCGKAYIDVVPQGDLSGLISFELSAIEYATMNTDLGMDVKVRNMREEMQWNW